MHTRHMFRIHNSHVDTITPFICAVGIVWTTKHTGKTCLSVLAVCVGWISWPLTLKGHKATLSSTKDNLTLTHPGISRLGELCACSLFHVCVKAKGLGSHSFLHPGKPRLCVPDALTKSYLVLLSSQSPFTEWLGSIWTCEDYQTITCREVVYLSCKLNERPVMGNYTATWFGIESLTQILCEAMSGSLSAASYTYTAKIKI